MWFLLIVFFFCPVLVHAQSTELAAQAAEAVKPEVRKETYPGGQLKSKAFYLNGKKVGIYKEYWESGAIRMKAEYNNEGLLDGQLKQHDQNGVLQSIEYYSNGQKVAQ